jgi:hypothetical protein
MHDDAKLMKEMSAYILMELMQSGLDAHQGMMVLAKTATSGFFADGLNREEAVERFRQVVDMTYDSIEESLSRRKQ